MLSYRQAKKELQAYVYANWTDGLANGLPNSSPALAALVFSTRAGAYTPKLFYRNIENRESIPTDKHFAIFTLSNVNTFQASLPGGRQNGGGLKYTTPGIGVIQLFFSKNNYTTEEEDLLTAICHEMFLGKSSANVWFRNPTVRELPEEEKHFKTNVTFEYEFDTHVLCPN